LRQDPGHAAQSLAEARTCGNGGRNECAVIAAPLERTLADLSADLDAARKAPGGLGQEVLERDAEIRRLSGRLRGLRRFGLDLCLGHMVGADGGDPVYVGRLGLVDGAGRQLLIDWRTSAAEPFFGATHANPMGLARRRRYRWDRGPTGSPASSAIPRSGRRRASGL